MGNERSDDEIFANLVRRVRPSGVPPDGLQDSLRQRLTDRIGDECDADEKTLAGVAHAIRPDTAVPPGVQEALRAKLIAQIESGLAAGREGNRWTRHANRRLILRVVVAAAAVVLIAVSVYFLAVGTSASFAQMLQNVRRAMTVSYEATLMVPGVGPSRVRVAMKRPGNYTFTSLVDGRVVISHVYERRALALNPATRTGEFHQTGTSDVNAEPMEAFENVRPADGRCVGKERQGGQLFWIYEIRQLDRVVRIWADSQTELPARIQVLFGTGSDNPPSLTLDNFQWDTPISDSVFALALPPGYTLQEPPKGTEADLVETLRICARHPTASSRRGWTPRAPANRSRGNTAPATTSGREQR